jgi:hypothetical protein
MLAAMPTVATPAEPRALVIRAHDLADAGQEVLWLAVVEMRRSLGFLPTPVEWSWTETDEVHSPDAVVILLPSAPAGVPAGVLAASKATTEPPTSWIYLDRVRWAMGHAGRPEPEAVFARALGRVMAHELIHALAPDAPHAHSGLMCERLSPAALRGESLALDEASHGFLERGVQAAVTGRRPLRATT